MRLLPLTHAERVDRGWNLLNEACRGWQRKITNRINLLSVWDCPLGQVYGSYTRGLDAIGKWAPNSSNGFHVRLRLFFSQKRASADAAALDAEWTRRLVAWREEQRLKDLAWEFTFNQMRIDDGLLALA